jgi:hypothetical protein
MLAKWVLVIRGIDGWDLLERVLDTGGIVMSMRMVMVLTSIGVSKSMETSKGVKGGVVRDSVRRLTLDAVFHVSKACQGGKELEDGKSVSWM